MIYSVKYRLAGQWFWRKLKNVKGDLIATEFPTATRVFILADESRLEVPLEGAQFLFDSGRFVSIKQRMEEEVGQAVSIKR